MKKEIKQEIKIYLLDKMREHITKLVSYYMVEVSTNKEAKDIADAAMFLERIYSGKDISPGKDKSFTEKHQDLINKINIYAEEINTFEKS